MTRLVIQGPVHRGNQYLVECNWRRLVIEEAKEPADPRIGTRIFGEPYWETVELV